jgi:hypothetical protein
VWSGDLEETIKLVGFESLNKAHSDFLRRPGRVSIVLRRSGCIGKTRIQQRSANLAGGQITQTMGKSLRRFLNGSFTHIVS